MKYLQEVKGKAFEHDDGFLNFTPMHLGTEAKHMIWSTYKSLIWIRVLRLANNYRINYKIVKFLKESLSEMRNSAKGLTSSYHQEKAL